MPRAAVSHTVCDRVRHWAAKTPEKEALLTVGGASVSYRRLAALMDELCAAFNARGFGRGDRVAIAHPTGAGLAMLWLGVASGMTAVPLNPSQTEEEFARQLAERRADGVLVPAGQSDAARTAARHLSLPVMDVVWHGDNPGDGVRIEGDGRDTAPLTGRATADDIALVLGTSGTTARSKIMPIRHRAFAARLVATAKPLRLTDGDRGLSLNPVFLHGGLSMTSTCLYSGGGAVFMASFDVETFFRTLDTLKPTWFHGSFTFMKEIIAYVRDTHPSIARGQLRFIRPTSGAIETETSEAMEEIFGAPVIEAFGSTETGRAACNPVPPGIRKHGTVGKAVNCEIAILGEDETFLPAGQEGEILIRGVNVIDGYENDDAESRKAFFDDWYRTGDLGFLDADGYLTLTGRIKEMINRGGEKISPAEIDSALSKHPDIADAAAFAIPHRSLGEIVGAAVVLAPGAGASKDDILRFLKGLLSPIKRPVAFLFLDEIPRTPIGKVKRTELAALYARRH